MTNLFAVSTLLIIIGYHVSCHNEPHLAYHAFQVACLDIHLAKHPSHVIIVIGSEFVKVIMNQEVSHTLLSLLTQSTGEVPTVIST